MKTSKLRFALFLLLVALIFYLWISGYIQLKNIQLNAGIRWHHPRIITDSNEYNPWGEFPTLELVIRTTSHPTFIKLYSTWFLKSLRLFWPEHLLNLTLLMDDENQQDHATGARLSKIWPYPNILYRKPGDPSVYTNNQRKRMYLSYFYPEEYVSAEYVGFVDTDTMFTTVVTPKLLFANGKPTVQARIGQPVPTSCWPEGTEYFLGEKEALQCMTYFPVIFKVEHVVEMRKFAEKRFGKPFLEIFKKSLHIHNPYNAQGDCVCQYSIICNYLWYHHREKYDFHLQMAPNGNWTGDQRRESQQSFEYFNSIDPKYLKPKPRVSIHARHYVENGVYFVAREHLTKDPDFTHLKRRITEGLCHSIWLDRCPKNCAGIEKDSLQLSIYSFERYNWVWDNRCIEEQVKHYENVKKLIIFSEKHGMNLFGFKNYSDVCTETFEFKV